MSVLSAILIFIAKEWKFMDFIKTLGSAVSGAKNYLLEKNKKSATANRLKNTAKHHHRVIEKAYLALGKYYYHNLRDVTNTVTEGQCVQIELSQKKLEETIKALEKLYSDEENRVASDEIELDDVTETGPILSQDEPADTYKEQMPLNDFNDEVAEGIVDEAVDTTAEFADVEENSKLPFES